VIPPRLSVCLDDLQIDVKSAMDRARILGFRAIDVGATSGALSSGELSQTGRRHLIKHLADLGLRLSSLRGPTAGPAYWDPQQGEQRLETMKGVIGLAHALGVSVVSTTLGPMSADPHDDKVHRAKESMAVLADLADRAGVAVAIEPWGMHAATLGKMISEIGCPMLNACCDSGAMLMQGDDPHRVAESLGGRIQLVRARDAVSGTRESLGHEVAQGEGDLDPPRFLAGLMEAGYQGDMVLTRTASEHAAADLKRAKEVFEEYLTA
jgi:sugar phosphate isomerase/epimerase